MTSNLSKELFAAITPETTKMNADIVGAGTKSPRIYELTPAAVAALRKSVKEDASAPQPPKSDRATERTIPGPGGSLTLRQIVPDNPLGVLCHIHGGGWVFGSANAQDGTLASIADSCNLAVVSVEFRQAPEDPYPAGPDDCEAAAAWLVKHAKEEYGSDALLIGGESSGASLSVVTMLRMRDKHGYTGFTGAYLSYGPFDLTLTPSARNFGDEPLVLNTPMMEWFVRHYARGGNLHDPDISPMYADLTNMPPALFTIGTRDPLLDDSLFMYDRWISAGIDAELAAYPGAPHGFDAFPTPIGLAAEAKRNDFLKSLLGTSGA